MKIDIPTALATAVISFAVYTSWYNVSRVEPGAEPSYLLYKNSIFSGRHPVATFWGHVDDKLVCDMAASKLNTPEANGRQGLYDCGPLTQAQLIPR